MNCPYLGGAVEAQPEAADESQQPNLAAASSAQRIPFARLTDVLSDLAAQIRCMAIAHERLAFTIFVRKAP